MKGALLDDQRGLCVAERPLTKAAQRCLSGCPMRYLRGAYDPNALGNLDDVRRRADDGDVVFRSCPTPSGIRPPLRRRGRWIVCSARSLPSRLEEGSPSATCSMQPMGTTSSSRRSNAAQMIGGPRWLDDQTCQVRLEISGTRVAAALVQIANVNATKTPIAPDLLAGRLKEWDNRTFSATATSTGLGGGRSSPSHRRGPPGRK